MAKKYGIDIDGVLCDFCGGFTEVLRMLGLKIPEGAFPTNWNWSNLGVDSYIMKQAWSLIDNDLPHFWEALQPHTEDMNYMVDFFNRNADKTCEIYFITSRNNPPKGDFVRVQSERWLRKYLGNPKQTINVIPVNHAMNKINVIDALGLDASIDDYLPTIINARSIRERHHAYLLAKPWNADREFYSVESVNSIKEFFEREENDSAEKVTNGK